MTEWRGHGPGPGCPCDSACESVDAALAAGPLGPGLARAGGPRLWGGQAGTCLANPQAGVPAATQRRASPAIAAAAAGSAPASAGPDGILPRRGYFTQVLSHGGLRLTGPPPLLAQAAFSVPQWLPVPAGQAVPLHRRRHWLELRPDDWLSATVSGPQAAPSHGHSRRWPYGRQPPRPGLLQGRLGPSLGEAFKFRFVYRFRRRGLGPEASGPKVSSRCDRDASGAADPAVQ